MRALCFRTASILFAVILLTTCFLTIFIAKYSLDTIERSISESTTARSSNAAFTDVILEIDETTHQVQYSTHDGKAKLLHQMIICAKVGNEIQYLPEWIEFHRIQGFTKFVLYTNDLPIDKYHRVSTNQLLALKTLYADVGDFDAIEVVTLADIFDDEMLSLMNAHEYPEETLLMHRLTQQTMLKHCWENNKNSVEWIAHMDIDEFIYAPKTKSLKAFMDSMYHLDTPPVAGGLVAAYLSGNMSGVYLWPHNFGMAYNNLLGPRVALRSNAMRGRTELVFDPALNFKAHDLDPSGEQLKRQIDAIAEVARTIRINETQDVRALYASILTLQLNNTSSTYISKMEAEMVARLTQQITQPASVEEIIKFFDQETERLVSDHFFFVTENQFRRMVSVDYGDSYDIVADAMIELFPDCAEYVNELRKPENAGLRSKIAQKEREAKLGVPHRAECVPGELPSHLTNIGKTIFWTGHRFNPPENWHRKQAYDRVPQVQHFRPWHDTFLDHDVMKHTHCQMPWVHYCSHKSWAPIIVADETADLRLDHHMVRSFESRTLADATWRVGQNKLAKFTVASELKLGILKFLTVAEDKGKLQYIPELRQRIARLRPHPLPSRTRLSKFALTYMTQWQHTRCQATHLLQRQSSMCPSSHPYVAILSHRVPPPTGLQPYGWCANKTSFQEQSWSQTDFDNASSDECFAYRKAEHCPDDPRSFFNDIRSKDIVFCPGWPLTNCCDHDQNMSDTLVDLYTKLGVWEAYRNASSRHLHLDDWIRKAF